MVWLKRQDSHGIFNLALVLGIAAVLSALIIYAYLGTFSRYLADDFCNARQFASVNLGKYLVKRYTEVPGGNRFSNILFIWASEIVGLKSVIILPALMIIVWVIGLIWVLHEVSRSTPAKIPRLVNIFMAGLIAFLSILQAPNRYQTLYWRSGMATHFAPVVFMAFLAAFVLQRTRCIDQRRTAWWVYPICLVFAFIVGGFSEPPDVVLIVMLIIVILGTWWRGRGLYSKYILSILIWTLGGALLALMVMILSPANQFRLGTPPPGFLTLVERSFRYTLEFIWDSIRTMITPTLISLLIPLFTFWSIFSHPDRESLSRVQRQRMWLVIAIVPLLMYVLISASFAPSVYGQSYPVERARFLGRFLMTVALMMEGAILGVLAAQFHHRSIKPVFISSLAAFLLIILAFYPVRAAFQTSKLIPVYRERAAAWDARDAQIRAYKAEGILRFKVEELHGIDGIKELDRKARHWVNRCAANYYGVEKIFAIPGFH